MERPPLAAAIVILTTLAGCAAEFDRTRIGCRGMAECVPGRSCCDVVEITGGRYDRGYDPSGDEGGGALRGYQSASAAPAEVSSFRMGVFEVTVGRFRRFLESYDAWRAQAHPRLGEGAHPALGEASGWQSAFDAALPQNARALEGALRCDTSGEATYEASGVRDNHPINCVSWHVALAFCIWDGGRLPTEAEWNYAAAGGDEQRAYPWSDPPSSIEASTDLTVSAELGERPQRVGSRAPADAGRFGAHDLAGNVREWCLDFAPADFADYPTPCIDCANLVDGAERIRRGGDFAADVVRGRTAYRGSADPSEVSVYTGIRCVY